MEDLAPSPVRDLATAVAAGQVSATDAVRLALDRIARLDPGLNSVVALRADPALAEAEALDARVRGGEVPGPLAGVPVLVKDVEDVAGMRTMQGSRLNLDAPPAAADGLIPARLRAAGAIVVGKTNVPEFATEGFTDNLVSGATRNPWSPEWSPGGSSGGSAAAVAAGLVPVATATDGGGSIRIPAAFCGLVGLKPTLGRIGSWPPQDWLDLSTFGPFATTVADLRLLLSVEQGPVAGDPGALPRGFVSIQSTPQARLLAAPRTSDLGPLPAEVQATLERAVAAMAELLHLPVQWLDPRDVFMTGDPDLDWFTIATADHVAALGRDRVVASLGLMHPAARAFMERGLAVGLDDYLAARRRRFTYVRRLDELLDGALLLTPTVAVTGWTPDGRLVPGGEPVALPPEVYSTAVQNITGHPAITLPATRSVNGVPFGLQVTAARHSDELLLDVAAAWERAHPWPRTAPGYDAFSLTGGS